ncbi:MAG: hypothetical protein V1722_05780 [Candidatus Micrarchaeota archaeon]
MRYWFVIVAIIVLLAVIVLPRYLVPVQTPSTTLSESEVVQIAQNYVETQFPNSQITSALVTSNENSKWKITVTYQQGTGVNCKVGKCYWEGPEGMYCRPESNTTLGTCS